MRSTEHGFMTQIPHGVGLWKRLILTKCSFFHTYCSLLGQIQRCLLSAGHSAGRRHRDWKTSTDLAPCGWSIQGQQLPLTECLLCTRHLNLRSIDMTSGFPGSSDSEGSVCNAGYPDSTPGKGRSPGEGNGNPLQYSCLGNPMGRGAFISGNPHSSTKQASISPFFINQCSHFPIFLKSLLHKYYGKLIWGLWLSRTFFAFVYSVLVRKMREEIC